MSFVSRVQLRAQHFVGALTTWRTCAGIVANLTEIRQRYEKCRRKYKYQRSMECWRKSDVYHLPRLGDGRILPRCGSPLSQSARAPYQRSLIGTPPNTSTTRA